MMNKKNDYAQLRQISIETLLEESNHVKYIWYAIISVALLVILFLIWAAFLKIKEVAVTFGEAVPKGQVRIIQHLEGGIVQHVYVDDGEKVKKGDLLLTFNPVAKQAELAQLRSREISLFLDIERLQAYINNENVNSIQWKNKLFNLNYDYIKHNGRINLLIRNEKNHLLSQNAERKAKQSVIETLIQQRQEKLIEARNQKKVWDEQVKLLNSEFKSYKVLREKKLVVNKDYMNVLRQLTQAKGEQLRTASQIEQLKSSIAEARNRLTELNSQLKQESFKELNEANNQLEEVRHLIEKTKDQLVRMNIKSPVDGIVKGLRASAGNVIKPGGILLEVVPFNQDLMIESQIRPRDIGHINVGDSVNVKFITYDFARYGGIAGTVTKISASTFNDAEGRPYYKATINLNSQHLLKNKEMRKLLPGMSVQADIITGEKTLLQYLLNPIQRSTDSAFHER